MRIERKINVIIDVNGALRCLKSEAGILEYSNLKKNVGNMNIQELINEGKMIREGLKYVYPPSNVMRLYDVYELQDVLAYTTWKNKSIQLLKTISDDDTVKSFSSCAIEFESKRHYIPDYLDQMLGILIAFNSLPSQSPVNKSLGNKVFVVHGHNKAIKERVARTLEKLGLKPIILHEQKDGGKTIIEKFESNCSDVNFAVILLSSDDKGKANSEKKYKGRARQNVIFEMGYFIGKLSRSHVFLLLEDGVERPSDLDGIIYTPMDDDNHWEINLVRELKGCGYQVSADQLI